MCKSRKKSPIMMDAKRTTPRHIIIKMPKVKDKERIIKTTSEKKLDTSEARWLRSE